MSSKKKLAKMNLNQGIENEKTSGGLQLVYPLNLMF